MEFNDKTAAFKEALDHWATHVCAQRSSPGAASSGLGGPGVETTSPGDGVLSRVWGSQRLRRSWEGSQDPAVSAGSAARPLCELQKLRSLWKPGDVISGSLLCLWNVWSPKRWIICYTETVHSSFPACCHWKSPDFSSQRNIPKEQTF